MKKILLAEDDAFLLDMFKNKFASSDFDVVTAEDGQMALDKIKEQDFDLLLLDVTMPKLNGFEVLKAIRRDPNPKKAGTPVVMLTNMSQQSDIDQGLQLGANDYIVKASFTPAEIVNRVNNLLWQKKK